MKHLKFFSYGFSALALCAALFTSAPARAEGYIGVLAGLGIPMATDVDYDSGSVFGATAGYHLIPGLGVAATYHHASLGLPVIDDHLGVTQLYLEANFFTFFGLNGGIHAGSVKESFGNASTTNLGFGPHLGMDVKLTNEISLGVAAYLTYVTADDKHSILDVVIPLKYWF